MVEPPVRRLPLRVVLPDPISRAPLPITLPLPDKVFIFNEAPSPIFAQKYGEGQGVDSTMRWVDIGSTHLSLIEKNIGALNRAPGILVESPRRSTAIGNIDEFQNIHFGVAQLGNSFRGFIMIEPENLLEAIQRLNYLGNLRIKVGDSLHYRWFQPMIRDGIDTRVKALLGKQLQALYRANPMSPLIQLFANDQAQIELIFDQLIEKAQWEDVEQKKRGLCTGVNITKPQKGQSRHKFKGNEFYTLEM